MGNDLQQNLKWLERQLLDQEDPGQIATEDALLLERVDALIDAFSQEEPAVGNFSRKSKGARAEKQAYAKQRLEESAAVFTKTKRQLRREAKLQKQAEKKATVNRKLSDLVFLAVLECVGILAILGWWFQ